MEQSTLILHGLNQALTPWEQALLLSPRQKQYQACKDTSHVSVRRERIENKQESQELLAC